MRAPASASNTDACGASASHVDEDVLVGHRRHSLRSGVVKWGGGSDHPSELRPREAPGGGVEPPSPGPKPGGRPLPHPGTRTSLRPSVRPAWEHTFVPRRLRFTEQQLREAILASRSWAETLRYLHYRSAGGNWRTLKKYAHLWEIPTDHFDPGGARRDALRRANPAIPLEEILVKNSTYSRNHLKERLFKEGVKAKRCELCGQGEIWRGRRMALIIDHINGVPNDNRLENLRIVCPNCAATFDTHCARKNRRRIKPRRCRRCGVEFWPRQRRQRYCSSECGARYVRAQRRGIPKPETRKVERPPYDRLLREIEEMGYLAVGRKYGVSDNAVRKWVRFYEREAERERLAAAEGDGGGVDVDAVRSHPVPRPFRSNAARRRYPSPQARLDPHWQAGRQLRLPDP